MNKQDFDKGLDELVGDLKRDVRVLQTQRQTLTVNLQDLESKRDKLSNDILNLEKKHSQVVKEYKDDIDGMMKSAQEKLTRATIKEGEAVGKVSELNQKIKEADSLIKSNQGLHENLKKQGIESQKKSEKLDNLIHLINETLDSI